MVFMEPAVTSARMRDGIELVADVYGAGPGPVLLMRSPYDRRSDVTLVMFDVERALQRGYTVVVQDTRGRFASEGVFAPFRSDIEDGYDTLDWLAAQPFCDGNVVMTGSSYLGATQWLAAISGHPALKAIAPALTASDYYEGWIYQGGAFQLAFNLFWALVHLAPEERRRRGIPAPEVRTPVYRRDGGDWPAAQASLAVAGEWLSHRPLGDVPLHDCGAYYFDWLEHDDPASPYRPRSAAAPSPGCRKARATIVRGWTATTWSAYSAQLSAPLEITGPVSAVVHVSTEAESHDVAVLLGYEHDGRLINLCDGIARVRSETIVEVDLLATSIEIPAGARAVAADRSRELPALRRQHRSRREAALRARPGAGDPARAPWHACPAAHDRGDLAVTLVRVGMAPRAAGLTPAECQTHWRTAHADAARSLPGLRGYVQNHAVLRDGEPLLPYPGFDVCAETEFDDLEAMDAAFASEQYQGAIVADELKLIDKARFTHALCERRVQREARRPGEADDVPARGARPRRRRAADRAPRLPRGAAAGALRRGRDPLVRRRRRRACACLRRAHGSDRRAEPGRVRFKRTVG